MCVVENKNVTLFIVTILGKKIQLSVPDTMSLNDCVNYLHQDKKLQLLGGTESVSGLTSVSIYKDGSKLCSHKELIVSLNKIDLKEFVYLQLVVRKDTYKNFKRSENSSEFEAIVNRHVSEKTHRQLQEKDIDHTIVIDEILFVQSILVFTVHDFLENDDCEIVKCKPNNEIYMSFEEYKKKYDIGDYSENEYYSIFNNINVSKLPRCKGVLHAVRYWKLVGKHKYDVVIVDLPKKCYLLPDISIQEEETRCCVLV